MFDHDPREGLLPPSAPNPIIWCERCQRYHHLHTFTRENYDRIIAEAAQKLADAIAAKALEVFEASYRR